MTTIQLRRDTASAWTTANTVLAQGEIGCETDTLKVKMGDGATAWTSLPYLGNTNPLPVGTTTKAPLVFASGTNLSTPAVGAVEFDGTDFYATAQASARQIIDTEQFCILASAYTLVSQTAAQKLLNTTTNGAVQVAVGTYFFECVFGLSGMSATSGSFGFALGGGATLASQAWLFAASKPASLNAGGAASAGFATAAVTALATGTNTTGAALIRGKVVVSAAGTLVPQVSLTIAAAAVVAAGSHFRIWPAGSSTVQTVGNWS